jgi:hypothetical protein
MTAAIVLANLALAIPFLVAFIAYPLWMTYKRQSFSGPDHSEAHRYLRAKAALAGAGRAPSATVPAARRPEGVTATRSREPEYAGTPA